MRIISGIFKGKKIIEPKDTTTRPLKDLTKESIFNIISHSNKFRLELSNVRVLDLFSGTGSPILTLYSIRYGSLSTIIKPVYKNPLYSVFSSLRPLRVGFIILLIIFVSKSLFINLDGEYAPIPPVFLP